MNTLFIYGNQYTNDIRAWILSNEIIPTRYIHGSWTIFKKSIDSICYLITTYKPSQIIFDEKSEYEDSIWDAVTSKCDNELDIGIDNTGTVIYYTNEK